MRRYLPAALGAIPLGLGLGLAWLLERGALPDLVFVATYQADLAALVARGGVLLSLIVWSALLMRRWARHRSEQARDAERTAQVAAHRRFLRRLDHELKNPLTIIRLGVANLQDSPGLPPEQTGSLARVAEQVNRLQKLVENLRRLAELEERELERDPVNLQEVLTEAVTFACDAHEGTERVVDVRVQQVPWPLTAVWGDRDLLVLAFRNLLDNALKFTAAGDQVEIRAMEDGRWAVVEVADTGPGIPPEELPHIFEELYRGRHNRDIPGSGLGLALVQRIVALHGGGISVRSRVGQGSVATVRLPLAPEVHRR